MTWAFAAGLVVMVIAHLMLQQRLSKWFVARQEHLDELDEGRPGRYCVMDDFSIPVYDEGGAWAETEVLGNHAIVKVRATTETLATIAADSRIVRLPASLLNEPLSSLTNGQRTALRDKIESLGYTRAELTNALGSNLGTRTLGEVLRFVARRRFKPRFDATADTFVFDGPEQVPRTVESVDSEV